ncbi:MAG: hypothetical protein A2511_07275 [Deltaproteobacteria bacterium RIFOXYD12_FULL_50_9]|nr:MAG: hypothetical protein A2511_07275 [Deltaproteobacteria bacterium RIFOXYD12_FULL_50_9]
MRILIFIIYIVVSIGVLAGCCSIQPSTSAKITATSTLSLTACQKADSMWNDKIIPTIYGDLPALTAPGVLDLFSLAKTCFTIRSLTNDSDELDVGHRKLVHAWGAEARFRFVSSKSARGYTGIYESGSDCVIGRLSMATKPTKTTTVPALALKFFISGHTSENLHIMNSTSGQESHNFFEMPFSNIIPPPDSFAKRLMLKLFRKAAVAYGAKDPDPTHLTVEHLAKIQVDGTAVVTPKSPYRLVFKPTMAAGALMKDATVDTDFRQNLARYPIDQVMYDVYAMDEGESADDLPVNKLVGHLIPTSNIVASSYGDEKLNFRHNMEK